MVYVLEGCLRYSVDGDTRDLLPGERMYTPKGSVHGFSNPNAETAKALIVLTPDIGVQYFRDIAEAVNGPGGPDPAKVVAVMARYGLQLPPKAAS
jgi:quercetin dioxygenase-like cupin family protein